MQISSLVVGTYLVILLALAAYGFHRTSLVWMFYRFRDKRPRPLGMWKDSDLPGVTIQLPLFNEMYVVRAPARRRRWHPLYPRDRFQIQVLDDSTDETQEICKHKIAELARRFPELEIEYPSTRVDRSGFKARRRSRTAWRTAKRASSS